MNACGFKLTKTTLTCISLMQVEGAFAVNWEQQSERLLQISGTLLEAAPINDISPSKYRLGLVLDVSILPKVNTTIGAKTEKVPNAPVHTVPTLFGSGAMDINSKMSVVGTGRLGYLIPGAESLLGVKAKLTQWTAGSSLGILAKVSKSIHIQMDLGAHLSNSKVVGAITSADSNDEFSSKATLFYISPGFLLPQTGLWGHVAIGTKSNESKLLIPSDQTSLATRDTLKGTLPVYLQPDVGYTHQNSGISGGLGFIFVPARAYFPKLHLAWNYEFQPAPKTEPNEKKSTLKKAKKLKKKKRVQ